VQDMIFPSAKPAATTELAARFATTDPASVER
jgi:hypothetical protein